MDECAVPRLDDECEGWDPESDLPGLEAGTCLVAPRLSSRGILRLDDEREGWDPESDLRGLEAGTRLVAPRLSSRGNLPPPFFDAP